MSFSKNQILNLIGILVTIVILIGVLRIVFWELNIFKKEASLPSDIVKIKQELDTIKNIKIGEISTKINELLPQPKTLEMPKINSSEIGKNNLFE